MEGPGGPRPGGNAPAKPLKQPGGRSGEGREARRWLVAADGTCSSHGTYAQAHGRPASMAPSPARRAALPGALARQAAVVLRQRSLLVRPWPPGPAPPALPGCPDWRMHLATCLPACFAFTARPAVTPSV